MDGKKFIKKIKDKFVRSGSFSIEC